MTEGCKKTTNKKALYILAIGILAICVSIIAALLVNFFPWSTRVHIEGIVIDKATKQPVPNARLIVTLRRKGIPYDGMIAKYGLVTNGDGKFVLDHEAPRRFHDMWLEASTPSNAYAVVKLAGKQVETVIYTSPLPKKLQNAPAMHYDGFAGAAPYLSVKHVEFIEGSWDIDR